jgi:hypothetical protein
VAAIVPGLALYGTFVPFPGYPERYGLYAGIAAIALVLSWLAVLKVKGRLTAAQNASRPL